MTAVGQGVGQVGKLGLQERLQARLKLFTQGISEMIAMLDDGLPDLPGQVQPIKFAVASFQHVHHPQGVGIVVEASMVGHQLIESILSRVSEGRVSEIMRE